MPGPCCPASSAAGFGPLDKGRPHPPLTGPAREDPAWFRVYENARSAEQWLVLRVGQNHCCVVRDEQPSGAEGAWGLPRGGSDRDGAGDGQLRAGGRSREGQGGGRVGRPPTLDGW